MNYKIVALIEGVALVVLGVGFVEYVRGANRFKQLDVYDAGDKLGMLKLKCDMGEQSSLAYHMVDTRTGTICFGGAVETITEAEALERLRAKNKGTIREGMGTEQFNVKNFAENYARTWRGSGMPYCKDVK